MVALVSFIASFVIARIFTTLYPNTVIIIGGGLHIHHFWYGLAMLSVGGWLGISYQSERIDRLAAILFGAGGGLVGDEIGLLLTFGDYWTGATYTFVIVFVTLASMLTLLSRYSSIIQAEFTQFLSNNLSLYVGVFLAVISIAFIMDADDIRIIIVSGGLTIVACIIILTYFIHRIRSAHRPRLKVQPTTRSRLPST